MLFETTFASVSNSNPSLAALQQFPALFKPGHLRANVGHVDIHRFSGCKPFKHRFCCNRLTDVNLSRIASVGLHPPLAVSRTAEVREVRRIRGA